VREADFKKKVRKFKSSSEVPKEWAQELSKKLKQTHSPSAIDDCYENSIGKLFS
jgi:hypothetical protein